MTYIILLIVLLLVIVLFINSIESFKWHKSNLGQESIKESDYYIISIFYYNPDDGRIIVPKKGGGGFTLNFGNSTTILFLIFILIFILIYVNSDISN